ncbi:MAG: U32 family peptidase [Clostridiales bacterium]|jgi:putative protease|nr:U32 family peptidase [Clostridiales bacterium]
MPDNIPELLAPAGNLNKLYAAFHFGADAVYIGGNRFSLRAFSDNFALEDIRTAVNFARSQSKKVFVALNIFPRSGDFGAIREYMSALKDVKPDGIIIGDIGVLFNALKYIPEIPVHISTQANTTNADAVSFYKSLGVKRVVLARELTIDEIKEIKDAVDGIELECFVHGAMCISYSGRCLLSNYLADRDSNGGKCVQACRWEYRLKEMSSDKELSISEDSKGTYIMNSKDLCMIEHIAELIKAGADSFKIEGRMKSEYYVGSVVNAYRRALDAYRVGQRADEKLLDELKKVGNRGYTTGFYLKENDHINTLSSKTQGENTFVAEVSGYDEEKGAVIAEQRNRFKKGDVLEVLSPDGNFLKKLTVDYMYGADGETVDDALRVQQTIYIKTDLKLKKHDILRK